MIRDNEMFSVQLKFRIIIKSWTSAFGTADSEALNAFAAKLSRLIEEFYKTKKSSFSKNEIHARVIAIT